MSASSATVPPQVPVRSPRSRRGMWAAVVTVLVLVVAALVGLRLQGTLPGVGGGSADASAPSEVAGPAAPGVATRDGATQVGGPAQGDAASDAASAQAKEQAGPVTAEAPVVGPKLARSAWLGIKVADLTAAAATVRAVAGQARGQVLSENIVTSLGPSGDLGPAEAGGASPVRPVGVNEARMTLRVPADALDGVLVQLSSARVGTVSYRSSQSEDVTDQYVDTAARITTMEQAVTQARTLLAKATSLAQIITLENEVTRRQADLDSLKSRMATLERRTTTADVTVTLWTSATQPETTEPNGFVTGLQDAWHYFLASATAILTGLAVLLPWLVIVLAGVLLVRRWRRRRGNPSPAGPSPAGPVAPGTGD